MQGSATRAQTSSTAPPSAPATAVNSRRAATPNSCWAAFVSVLFRVDVYWTIFYFLFLAGIAVTTTAITQTVIVDSLLSNLHTLHSARIQTILTMYMQSAKVPFNIGSGFFALQAQKGFAMHSETTLSALCTTLNAYDKAASFRYLAYTSVAQMEAVACMHGDRKLRAGQQMYGWITVDTVINGTYLVNSTNFKFEQPLQPVYGGWPLSAYNLSAWLANAAANDIVLNLAEDFYYGRTDSFDHRLLWRVLPELPHIIYFSVPAGLLFKGMQLAPGMSPKDYLAVRVQGSILLTAPEVTAELSATAAAFIHGSLSYDDPWILSNNWGQESVNDTDILFTMTEHPVSYLTVSNVSNPLMRAALKHVDFKMLQQSPYEKTVDFIYKGSPAVVTAMMFSPSVGLAIPIVFVSANAEISLPYRRIQYIFDGVNGFVIVVITALFWWFIKGHLRNPLLRIAALLLSSANTGSRRLFHRTSNTLVELTEVRQLADAYNATMRQLREIDTFIPKTVRRQLQRFRSTHHSLPALLRSRTTPQATTTHGSTTATKRNANALRRHLSTIVSVTLRPQQREDTMDALVALRSGTEALPGRQRLAAIAANAARTVAQVNSGPFASPESLTAFATRVHELCEAHHGSLLRLSPDSVVIHFHHAVRAQLLLSEASAVAVASTSTTQSHHEAQARRLQERSTRDAYDAAAFALELQRWVDECAAPLPDMHMLLDTALFTCGHYRALGSDQTVPVALGRDVQREVGHVPAKIGVRIAMTEETAQRVRYKEAAALGSRGVRQIPVEAFHTGRRGLNLDAVVLFEVLPGSVAGDAAWLSFERDCSKAFGCMIQGDYVEALRSYRSVATIVDLEPGLMPRSLRREAAAASVTGGATSTQVQRLMRECLQRIRDGCTEGFHRVRHVPLGIDAQLTRSRSVTFVPALVNSNSVDVGDRNPLVRIPTKAEVRALAQLYPAPQERHVVEVVVGGAVTRRVFRPPSAWISDNVGLRWHLGTHSIPLTIDKRWFTRIMGLGDAGAVSTVSFLAFREVPPLIERLLRDAPLGVMSDQLRSAVPVAGPTPQQEAMLHTLFTKHQTLLHPNLLTPLGYSTDEEGGVVIIWEHCAGGTMRDVIHRYLKLKPLTIARFMCNVLSGLAFLHSNGLAHGAFHMHNIMVHADGECRMLGYSSDMEQAAKLFVLPATCYISPHMAAGHSPTPACDMFCYGLMCIEMHSKGMVWKWASAEAAAQHSEEELEALLKDAGQDFRDAVVTGRLVPATNVLDTIERQSESVETGLSMVRACLATEPHDRPSAAQMLKVAQAVWAHGNVVDGSSDNLR